MSSFYYARGPDTDPLALANEKTRQLLPQAAVERRKLSVSFLQAFHEFWSVYP